MEKKISEKIVGLTAEIEQYLTEVTGDSETAKGIFAKSYYPHLYALLKHIRVAERRRVQKGTPDKV